MGLFTDIYNTVAKFFRQSDEPVAGDASKAVATNRLKLVLMQDRTNLTPRVLEQMRSELIDLLSKYLEMDKDMLELNFEHEGDQVALMLSIPVIRAKDEEEIEEALNVQKEDSLEEENVSEEGNEDENNEEVIAETDENEEAISDDNNEESAKPRRKRTKKVTAPEELEAKNEAEITEDTPQEVSYENTEA